MEVGNTVVKQRTGLLCGVRIIRIFSVLRTDNFVFEPSIKFGGQKRSLQLCAVGGMILLLDEINIILVSCRSIWIFLFYSSAAGTFPPCISVIIRWPICTSIRSVPRSRTPHRTHRT